MFTFNHFLRSKAGLLLSALFCVVYYLPAYPQTHADASRWKPWIISDAAQVKLSSPPGKEQTQKELAEVKEKNAKRTEQILYQIKYWDAGSPAYRWNEIAYSLTTFENFNTFLREPMAWMNMAIYDATLLAWKAKYNYHRKRPFEIDQSLKPAVNPPGTPSYPCEHSVTAAAAAHVLAYFFPEAADSILKLAKEAAQSRIYAGVQFPSDVADGWKLGEQVAALVIKEAKKDGSDKPWNGTMPGDAKLWSGP